MYFHELRIRQEKGINIFLNTEQLARSFIYIITFHLQNNLGNENNYCSHLSDEEELETLNNW